MAVEEDDKWKRRVQHELLPNDSFSNPTLHLILPLSGRSETMARFAAHLRTVCADTSGLSLTVVLFASLDEQRTRETLADLARYLPVRIVEMGNASFSRGVALTKGAEALPQSALLFFTDVDMLFTCDALDRIRKNTIRGAQVRIV